MTNDMFGWLAIALAAALVSRPCEAEQYYLSPDGDDDDSGTRQAPWRSLAKACTAVQPGDTVVLLPGRYAGELRPRSGGTADAEVVFRAEPRLQATLTGPDNGRAVVLENLEHVRLEGLHIDPDGPSGGWIRIGNCAHVTVDDCRMENSTYGLAAHIENASDIRVRNSVFRKQTGGINMFRISSVTRLLFEGNVISRAGHSPLQFYPPDSNRYLVLRGNVFHAAWGRSFEFFHDRDVLFEHNIITYAFNSGWSGSSNAKLGLTRGIFRFNRVFRNAGGAINMYTWRNGGAMDTIRLYHNIFDDNAHYGIGVSSAQERARDILFINNIFCRNDRYGTGCQLRMGGGTPEQVRVLANVFRGQEPDSATIHDYGSSWSVADLQSQTVRAEHGQRYEGNRDVAPGFVDPEQYNHALRPDSPLRHAGRFLTRTRGAGEGVLVPVGDAACFYDGFGIEGEHGDLIAVGTAGRPARVLDVDCRENTLRLDREMSWADGDPVSLPWAGAAPDIGVYEHGDEGRVAVQVRVEPFEARPGQPIRMHAVLHGGAVARQVRWWLGDGTVAEGAEIRHQYAAEYDYPVRVEVLDASGQAHRGTGYVWVAEPIDPAMPLVHSTWGPEDDAAWRLWKSYSYPGPAGYRDVVEGGIRHGPNSRNMPSAYVPPGGGVNYRHVRAPADKGGLPTRIHPRGWDVDRYPEILIRYRLGAGTPLALSLKPFGRPALLVALSPAGKSSLQGLAKHVLHDDGNWHELRFDARAVRQIHPEVQALEGLYFLGSPRDAVKEGHWYDLDEVIIGP